MKNLLNNMDTEINPLTCFIEDESEMKKELTKQLRSLPVGETIEVLVQNEVVLVKKTSENKIEIVESPKIQ